MLDNIWPPNMWGLHLEECFQNWKGSRSHGRIVIAKYSQGLKVKEKFPVVTMDVEVEGIVTTTHQDTKGAREGGSKMYSSHLWPIWNISKRACHERMNTEAIWQAGWYPYKGIGFCKPVFTLCNAELLNQIWIEMVMNWGTLWEIEKSFCSNHFQRMKGETWVMWTSDMNLRWATSQLDKSKGRWCKLMCSSERIEWT